MEGQEKHRKALDCAITLANWLGELTPAQSELVADYEMKALYSLADAIGHVGVMRSSHIEGRWHAAEAKLLQMRIDLRRALEAEDAPRPAEEVPAYRNTVDVLLPIPPGGSPGANGERSDTTSQGEGGMRRSPPLVEPPEWRKEHAPATEARSQAAQENSVVKQGVFRGLHVMSSVVCRDCKSRVRVYQAVAQQRPAIDLCQDCHDLAVRVRSGPVASAPWEGVPDDAPVICDGCGLKSKAGLERRSWPLPDFCVECDRKASPEGSGSRTEDYEEMMAHVEGRRALGKVVIVQPVVKLTPEGAKEVGSYVHEVARPVAENGTKGGETFSRKRPRASKNAQNFREKREERFRQVS